MRRFIFTVLAIVTLAAVAAAVDLYPCSLYVQQGTHLTLRAWYLHEAPGGECYYDTDQYYSYQAPVIASVLAGNVEGYPVAFEWIIEGSVVKTCGIVPTACNVIFADGFESGNTNAWN